MATNKARNKNITTEKAVAYVLDSDFSDQSDDESCWGMDTDEEEYLDDMLEENEFEIIDQRYVQMQSLYLSLLASYKLTSQNSNFHITC